MKNKLYILILTALMLSALLSSCAEDALGIDDNVVKNVLEDTTNSHDNYLAVKSVTWETIVESYPQNISEYPFWFFYTKITENKVFVDTRAEKPVFRLHFAGENDAPENILAKYHGRIDRIMKFEIKLDSISFDQKNRVRSNIDRDHCKVLVRNFRGAKTLRLIERDNIEVYLMLKLNQTKRQLSGVVVMQISPAKNLQTGSIAISFNVEY
ncbi:MAG: hypothetical protein PF588_02275 [Candidatus Kapabacteria bacterium]|nr:hypothetical protein [Candidatus Kapabacteria bacterium]